MPAKSQAQRAYLFATKGKKWVEEHGFDNPGHLPKHIKKGKKRKKGMALRTGRYY